MDLLEIKDERFDCLPFFVQVFIPSFWRPSQQHILDIDATMPPKRKKLQNAGILSNSYVPPLRAVQVERELQKLPPDSLFSLTQLWLTLLSTQPIPSKDQKKQGYTKKSLAKEHMRKLDELGKIKGKAMLKKRLINLILVEFYPSGINTLQLAQIDVQLLVDQPNMNTWVSSTAKIVSKTDDVPNADVVDDIQDEKRNEMVKKLPNFPISLDSQLFLDNFIMNLSNLYLTHVYISRHPYYPLLLIRVQMYDYSLKRVNDQTSRRLITDLTNSTLDKMARARFEQDFQNILSNKYGKPSSFSSTMIKNSESALQRQIQIQSRPQVKSHKPFYILLPISSPHIIHTPSLTDDVSTKLILQTLATTISQSRLMNEDVTKRRKAKRRKVSGNELTDTSSITFARNEEIMIFRDSDVKRPMRNLNTIFTLKGISRFAGVSGAWSPYADDAVDMGILEEELKHLVVQPEGFIDLTESGEEEDDTRERKIVAGLKFKGRVGKRRSGKMFETKYGVIDLTKDEAQGSITEAQEEGDEGEEGEEQLGMLEAEKRRLADTYASAVPVSSVQFTVDGDLNSFCKKRFKRKGKAAESVQLKDPQFKFQLELFGNDIYGGLHELAVRGEIDPYTIPDWLTGENGAVGGVIKKTE